MVFLDANESPFNHPYNRYPDPLQRQLKGRIAELKQVPDGCIFLGNGSDEPIDLLIRAFCVPGQHHMIQIEPTYGMYQVAAGINHVEVVKVPLSATYKLNAGAVLNEVTENTRIIFLCSPNNPTGNALDSAEMIRVIEGFEGPVVVDEAYIDFAPGLSLLPRLAEFGNLVILQTFSKAWGMAGIRLGMAFASPEVISVLNKIKYPYNLNILTQQKALELLSASGDMENWVDTILNERQKLASNLEKIPYVKKVWPSDANFLLVKMDHARKVYESLVDKGIIVRDRSKILLCEDSLRITVGSRTENETLIQAMREY